MPSTSPPAFLLFLSLPPLCLPLANLSLQTPYQPVVSSDSAVVPSSRHRKNDTFHTISSLTRSHFSHQSFSSSLALIPDLLPPPNPCGGVVWMQELIWRPAVAEKKPLLRSEQQTADGFLGSCGSVPVLYHDHGHPVGGIHMFPNQVLEKQEWLHQEILWKMDIGKKQCVFSIQTNPDFCRCAQVCTHHQIGGPGESLYVRRIVAIIHLTEYGCHARYDSRLHNCEHRRKGRKGEPLGSGDIRVC